MDTHNITQPYTRRALELRAAEYYDSIGRPESEWHSSEDIAPQIAAFEHYVNAEMYDVACRILLMTDYKYLYWWGNYPQLVDMQRRISGRVKPSDLQIYNLESMGRSYRALGNIELAIEFYNLALAKAQESQNRWQEGDQLSNLGYCHHLLGMEEAALQFYQRAADIARDVQTFHRNEDIWIGGVGLVHHSLGEFVEAIQYYREALAMAHKIGHRFGETIHLGRLGIAHRALGEIEQATEHLTAALEIAREVNHRLQESFLLGRLGFIHLDKHQYGEAIQAYQEALSICSGFNDKLLEGRLLLDLGKVHLLIGDVNRSYELCQKACRFDSPPIAYLVNLALGINLLYQDIQGAGRVFDETVSCCQFALNRTSNRYKARYVLAAALVGRAVCTPCWSNPTQRAALLTPALAEYQRALEITAAQGVIRDAWRDLEHIRVAGVEGLDPVLEFLKGALHEQR